MPVKSPAPEPEASTNADMDPEHGWETWVTAVSILVIVALIAVVANHFVDMSHIREAVRSRTGWPLVAAVVVLPLLGVPLSVFLLLLGARYGFMWGIAAAIAVLPVHMSLFHVAGRWLFRDPVRRFLRKRGRTPPKIPENNVRFATFVIMAIPIAPYPVKNMGMVVAGVPARLYYGIGWPVQTLIAVPMVGIGASVLEARPGTLTLFILLLLGLTMLTRWLMLRYRSLVERGQ
ncbi:MAG: TVP38/TMEM64 family protein [Desulfatibacillaceae bacterium]